MNAKVDKEMVGAPKANVRVPIASDEEALERIKEKAKNEGETFIVELLSEELKDIGFGPWEDWSPHEFFDSFEFVDVYLLYDAEMNIYKLKYVFDGNPTSFYYESEQDLGKYFWSVVADYIEAGEKA